MTVERSVRGWRVAKGRNALCCAIGIPTLEACCWRKAISKGLLSYKLLAVGGCASLNGVRVGRMEMRTTPTDGSLRQLHRAWSQRG